MTDTIRLSGLYIGTSGWSYKHWAGIFYPELVKPDKYLEYYITQFDCVELNSSFYHLPKNATASGWMKRTPETFKFCPKLSRYITHQLRLMNSEEALMKYFDIFDIMKARLGPVLVQLPPGMVFDKTLTDSFLHVLKERYSDYRFAIEVRHKSWITDDFFSLLKQYGFAFVMADSGKRYPYYETITADYIYMRFHGHEKLYASDYSESDLRLYAEKITGWLNENKEVWVFFNNDFYGFAVKNAENLIDIVHSYF
jgi:uncharacterized protein YecE (DUF72 family)